jgi:hypothetical protein
MKNKNNCDFLPNAKRQKIENKNTNPSLSSFRNCTPFLNVNNIYDKFFNSSNNI